MGNYFLDRQYLVLAVPCGYGSGLSEECQRLCRLFAFPSFCMFFLFEHKIKSRKSRQHGSLYTCCTFSRSGLRSRHKSGAGAAVKVGCDAGFSKQSAYFM